MKKLSKEQIFQDAEKLVTNIGCAHVKKEIPNLHNVMENALLKFLETNGCTLTEFQDYMWGQLLTHARYS